MVYNMGSQNDPNNITFFIDLPLDELLSMADRARRAGVGADIELCGIVNAKSGACSEDCRFCAQSAHHSSDIGTYPLMSPDEIYEAAREAEENGAARFGIVTSGNRMTPGEVETIAFAIRRIKKDLRILPCASLGALDKASFDILREAGLVRYHHNIETSEGYYSRIVTTHDYSERINTVKAAKKAGLEVCSGGIIGLGESWQDRIDMALLLKELDVDSVPLNFLIPVEGTPLEDVEMISPEDALRTIAMFRMTLPDKTIKVAAGREAVLEDRQDMIYAAGANGMMIGGYLTVAGRSVEDDLALTESVKELWIRG